MDDFKWLFYVIVAIIYFIIQSKKKKAAEQTSQQKPLEQNQPTGNTSKPFTFEDLLREIQQGKAATPRAEPVPPPIQQYVPPQPKPAMVSAPAQSQSPKYEDYDDNIEKDEKDLENVDYDYRNEDKIYETYETAKKEAFNKASLEETMHVEDTVVKYGRFKEFNQEALVTMASSIATDFKDKANIRKAFILSEILNRRY
jgi:hypothetical protein